MASTSRRNQPTKNCAPVFDLTFSNLSIILDENTKEISTETFGYACDQTLT